MAATNFATQWSLLTRQAAEAALGVLLHGEVQQLGNGRFCSWASFLFFVPKLGLRSSESNDASLPSTTRRPTTRVLRWCWVVDVDTYVCAYEYRVESDSRRAVKSTLAKAACGGGSGGGRRRRWWPRRVAALHLLPLVARGLLGAALREVQQWCPSVVVQRARWCMLLRARG